MPLADADLPVAEPVVQRERRLVVREDVQLDLAYADSPRPVLGLLHERAADPAPPEPIGDHEAHVRDVLARGVAVPPDRKPADDHAVELGDEHGGVRMPTDRLEVASLLGHAPPVAVGDEPASLFRPDRLGKVHERPGVAGLGVADDRRHSTIAPAPPRLGSPAASSLPSAPRPTADAPPK